MTAQHHQPRGRLAQAPVARLRLDLSVRRRRLQHRRRRRPEPPRGQGRQARDAGRQPARGLRRLQGPVRAGARARRRRPLAGRARPRAEGRAAALLARRRAARGARRSRHRRSGGQHLRLHRRGHRQGDGDRRSMPPRRSLPALRATPPTPATRRSAPTTRRACSRSSRASISTRKPTAPTRIPWLIDLLVWSARRSPRRVQRMAGVLEETHIPTDAVTVRGVLRRLSTGAEGRAAQHPSRPGEGDVEIVVAGASSSGATCRRSLTLEETMDYMLMFYETSSQFEQRRDRAASQPYWAGWMAYVQAMHQSGVVKSGAGLQEPATGDDGCASSTASDASRTARSPTPRSSSAASSSSTCPTSTAPSPGRRAPRARRRAASRCVRSCRRRRVEAMAARAADDAAAAVARDSVRPPRRLPRGALARHRRAPKTRSATPSPPLSSAGRSTAFPTRPRPGC